ncbi:MAG TPA: metalloregulator ArsR/SmtB family transcription factor [Candidatus Kapabacteria bacterium]|nr:metalloregulator ArsR/SmtB family transcription factor [Candidatus Kapabacteria bacterium]
MAQNKKDQFDQEITSLSDLANAISHPARVAILRKIAERQGCICGEIVEVLPLAQSTVSQHLKELLKANLIKGTVDGTKSCYCINWDAFSAFEKIFGTFFSGIAAHNISCC